ncbi:threonine/homoserine exporter RhtA [Salinicola aestuarinus]|uniref:threonine/homoserine exporter RhtA n=1 Tax=Salinicola aestuarinus TaxID=1949082 RepID=UPI000DA161AF|nr:threonine/homoserine exporter RhtA [Salinicola aestuarinus]
MSVAIHGLVARLWPVAMLVVAMVSIQSGASLVQSLFPTIGATGATSIRLILASIMLLAAFRPWRRPVARRAWKMLILYGVSLGCMNFLLYQAIESVPLGIAVALEFTGPLAVAVFSSRRRLDLLWVALAVIGLALLLLLGDEASGSIDPYGATCALGAGVCWALYILFGQRAGAVNGAQSAAIGVTIAAIVIAPIGLIDAGSALLSLDILPIALGVALLSTAIPYTLEMIAMSRMPTPVFGTLMSLEPAIGALCGVLFLSQHLGELQWSAIALIVVASIGTTLATSQRPGIEAPVPD